MKMLHLRNMISASLNFGTRTNKQEFSKFCHKIQLVGSIKNKNHSALVCSVMYKIVAACYTHTCEVHDIQCEM